MAAAVSLVVGVTTVPTAHAATDLSGQLIQRATLSRTGAMTDPLRNGDSVKVGFDWAANGTSVSAGDFIQITLPNWAAFPNSTVDMNSTSGEKMAECVQANQTVTCTFNDFAQRNPNNLQGQFFTTLQFSKEGTITPTVINVGNHALPLTMIANQDVIDQGIQPGVNWADGRAPILETNRKEGTFFGVTDFSDGKALIRWDLYVGGIDGTITLKDALAKPQAPSTHDPAFVQGVRVLKRDKNAEGGAGGNWTPAADGGTAYLMTQGNEYSVNWVEGAASNDVTVTIPNATSNKYYLVQIFTQIPADAVPDGTEFNNTANVNGAEISTMLNAQNMLGAWGSGDPSKGDIYVYKDVTVEAGAQAVPETENLTFQIEATWEDNGQQTRTLTIPVLKSDNGADATAAGKLADLPPGTQVTLRELPPANGTNYNWTTTTIREGKYGTMPGKNFVPNGYDGRAVTVTVVQNKRIEVNFNNSYNNTPATKKVSVGDYVWLDTDKDGIQDANEEGLNGFELQISRQSGDPVNGADGQALSADQLKTTTAAKDGKDGYYIFDNLQVLPDTDRYIVTVAPKDGYVLTTAGAGDDRAVDSSDKGVDTKNKATSVALTQNGEHDPTLDFGFIKPSVSVGDYVWFDSNKDGLQDDTETGINGVTVTLSRSDNQPAVDVTGAAVQPKQTTANPDDNSKQGYYVFDNLPILPAGEYYKVTVTTPEGYAPTVTKDNDDVAKDSDNPTANADQLTQDGQHDPKLDFGFIKPKVSVGDYVWWDENKDGIQDDNEQGIGNVTLTLSRTDGENVVDAAGVPVPTTTTNEQGLYTFDNLPVLPQGVFYKVTVTDPAGYVPTKAGQGTDTEKDSSAGHATAKALPNDGDRDPSLDFGYVKKSVAVGDYVWFDQDRDGIQDEDEKGIENVELTISRTDKQPVTDVNGRPVTTTRTDENGLYKFDNLPVLPAGEKYEVTVTNPAGMTPTTSNQGGDTAKDSDNPKATARELPNDGEQDLTLDFGFVAPKVSVGDYVWFDANKDGIQDDTEKGLEGFKLTISRSDDQPVEFVTGDTDTTTTTDGTGFYTFDNLKVLPEGVFYKVTVSPQRGYVPTKSQQGGDTAKDSDNPTATAVALPNHGDHDPKLDFGFIPAKVSVGDYVWFDKDRDGIQDEGEKGIENVTVTIKRTDGEPVVDTNGKTLTTKTTDEDGFYEFTDLPVLPEGEFYEVTVTTPEGYKPTESNKGDDRAKDSENPKAKATDLPNDGDRDPTLDFGFVKPSVSVGDYVWFDENKDGLQDATDKPIKDVKLALVGPDGQPVTNVFGEVVGTTTTDENGFYQFIDLPVLQDGQSYTVKVEDPKGYKPTTAGAGERDKDSSTGEASSQGLTQDGESDMTLDFGYIQAKVSVGDYVWFDQNRDGDQDDDEPGIEGVELKITDNEGNPVKDVNGNEVPNTRTDKDGGYEFTDLPPLPEGGNYVVTVVENPEGYLPTKPNATEDPEKDSDTGSAKTYQPLDEDGDRDPSLDFGFVKPMGKLEIAKKVEGISGIFFERNTEFTVVATWTQDGKEESRTLTVRHGHVNGELPELYAGTVVTLREELPANNLLSQWQSPSFAVENATVNADGSVSVTIPAHTDANEPVKVIAVGLTNVANPPLPWILVPLIPLLLPPPPAPNTPQPPAEVTPTPTPSTTPSVPTKGVEKGAAKAAPAAKEEAPAKKGLANTGASVWAVAGLAVLLMVLGAFLALRSRKN